MDWGNGRWDWDIYSEILAVRWESWVESRGVCWPGGLPVYLPAWCCCESSPKRACHPPWWTACLLCSCCSFCSYAPGLCDVSLPCVSGFRLPFFPSVWLSVSQPVTHYLFSFRSIYLSVSFSFGKIKCYVLLH